MTWLETKFERPQMKPGGVRREGGRHSQSFHIRCQLSQRGIVEGILKCSVFAFVPSEPILLTFSRRTNEIQCCVLCCPSPLTAGRQ